VEGLEHESFAYFVREGFVTGFVVPLIVLRRCMQAQGGRLYPTINQDDEVSLFLGGK
jgi:hypothetical protein